MDSTITAARPTSVATVVSAVPTFSYAQAAKGHATSAAASASHSSQTPSGVSTPVKEIKSSSNTPSGSVNGTMGSDAGDRSNNTTQETINAPEPANIDVSAEVMAELSTATNPSSESTPTSPSYGAASTSTIAKEDDLSLAAAVPSDTRGANKTERHAEHTEGRRGRKGKKQKNAEKDGEKEAEKEKEEIKQEVLVPAQAPAVNFWKQRIEEQAAKAKANPMALQNQHSFSELGTPGDVTELLKTGEQRRRGGKSSVPDDGEAVQNGGSRESLNGKGQRKGSESASRAKDDPPAKRSAARTNRGSEKDEKPIPTLLPPPVEDATSWPTPETALEEDKRKAQEKEKVEKDDKDESTSNKPRQKEKWVSVPYIPTVTFNTPLPSARGGRGRGGARGARQDTNGRSSHGSGGHNGEKAQNSTSPNSSAHGEPERRSLTRANSLPPSSSKKQQTDQSHPRDRKSSGVPTNEKSKVPLRNETGPAIDDPRVTNSSKSENSPESRRDHQTTHGDSPRGFKHESGQAHFNGYPSNSRPGDRRSEPNLRDSELFREGSIFHKEVTQGRERTDGRSDRGRGGYRGRGGHSNFPSNQQNSQHPFTNGHGSVPSVGYSGGRISGPYSPPLQQTPFNNQFNTLPLRGSRGGGSRSQSIPNNNVFGRFPSSGNPQQMGQLQTSLPMFDYPQQSLSATPYNPFVDQYSVLAMVTMQVEYYFSIDNLCKDVYLRKHMDFQGFVFLTFIAGFKRIQALTQDLDLLRYACQESEVIEIIRADDGIDRIRRREGWEQWVLAKEDRDESVRIDGPVSHYRQVFASRSQPMAPMGFQSQLAMAPPAFTPNGTNSSARPYGNGAGTAQVLNGNGVSHHPETPLSAAVPDFSPSLPPLESNSTPLDLETTFTDEEVPWLILVFYPQKVVEDDQKPKMPARNISSRTFSNGSIDGRSISEAIQQHPRQGQAVTNGSGGHPDISPEVYKRSLSPFSPLLSPKSVYENGPPVMWVKGQRGQALISEHNTQEMYTSFRDRALKHREATPSGVTHIEMRQLYEFWSHFLCRNFNPAMYSEFRKAAYEDAEQKAMTGMTNLTLYYDEILNSKKQVIPETLARHYVELVKFEEVRTDPNDNRPAFTKLRATLRNGALDLKSRKKIDTFVDVKLRAELER